MRSLYNRLSRSCIYSYKFHLLLFTPSDLYASIRRRVLLISNRNNFQLLTTELATVQHQSVYTTRAHTNERKKTLYAKMFDQSNCASFLIMRSEAV